MSMVPASGLSIHVEQLAPSEPASGAQHTAPTAVLIHGLALDTLASWYLTLAHPLAAAGFHVIMYDLRGHGHTERPPEGYALDNFVDDLAALLDALDITGPVHLFGNSFGGTIAFSYAARHPERVAAIVTVESMPPTATWLKLVPRWLGNATAYVRREYELAERNAGRRVRAGRWAKTIDEVLAATSLARDVPASRLPAEERIAAIGCPALCVFGGESNLVEVIPDVRRLLPQARIVIVPGQRHSVLVDQPNTIRDIVMRWLREHCGIRSDLQLTSIDQ
ncbi:alpha/beta fold hydrolase [Dactylosporangium sucinum]|uniref:Alpha/beta hydrolase n=1 Tax=Dactylosporangium sucinum TaxID=1424081 RepID=A0A917UIP5_9ACTN|nr:alpha/beta hydrolase [Dactylosporangium sucinum]GGM89068.1 alpha/beta hydrolase [Dactylosporangium sucinum]